MTIDLDAKENEELHNALQGNRKNEDDNQRLLSLMASEKYRTYNGKKGEFKVFYGGKPLQWNYLKQWLKDNTDTTRTAVSRVVRAKKKLLKEERERGQALTLEPVPRDDPPDAKSIPPYPAFVDERKAEMRPIPMAPNYRNLRGTKKAERQAKHQEAVAEVKKHNDEVNAKWNSMKNQWEADKKQHDDDFVKQVVSANESKRREYEERLKQRDDDIKDTTKKALLFKAGRQKRIVEKEIKLKRQVKSELDQQEAEAKAEADKTEADRKTNFPSGAEVNTMTLEEQEAKRQAVLDKIEEGANKMLAEEQHTATEVGLDGFVEEVSQQEALLKQEDPEAKLFGLPTEATIEMEPEAQQKALLSAFVYREDTSVNNPIAKQPEAKLFIDVVHEEEPEYTAKAVDVNAVLEAEWIDASNPMASEFEQIDTHYANFHSAYESYDNPYTKANLVKMMFPHPDPNQYIEFLEDPLLRNGGY